MTKQELEQFENRLREMGYNKQASHRSAEYAWMKSVGQSKYEDNRCNYIIIFSIYDFTKYNHAASNPYTLQPSILLSRTIDERYDLDITSHDIRYDIDKVESLAESFYQWAEKEIEL